MEGRSLQHDEARPDQRVLRTKERMMDTALETKTEPKAMKRSIWPLAGVAFVVILLAGAFSAPVPPQPGDPVGEIRSYYVDHATGVQIYVYASALSAVFFLMFVVSIQQAMLRLGETSRVAASAVSSGSSPTSSADGSRQSSG